MRTFRNLLCNGNGACVGADSRIASVYNKLYMFGTVIWEITYKHTRAHNFCIYKSHLYEYNLMYIAYAEISQQKCV